MVSRRSKPNNFKQKQQNRSSLFCQYLRPTAARKLWALGLAISGLSLGLLHSVTPAIAQKVTPYDLDQAICANDWPTAINIVSRLMAQDETTNTDRNSLLLLRRQLERYQTEGVLVTDDVACDRVDSYYLQPTLPDTVQTGEPLGWEAAVAEATNNSFNSEVITESIDLTLPVALSDRQGLTPATPIDLNQGISVVSGHVGQGHDVFAFVAGLGDRIEADLNVTRVMTGSLYTSDDSQLFIFDRHGNLVAAADDTDDSPQSQITGITIPKTDLYYAVVTTYNNDPILNREGRLAGWQDNGGGRFDYTLTISGATPTRALVR